MSVLAQRFQYLNGAPFELTSWTRISSLCAAGQLEDALSNLVLTWLYHCTNNFK